MARRIVLIFLLAAVTAPLGACGRRSALEAPEGSTYPRTYPADPGIPGDDNSDKKN